MKRNGVLDETYFNKRPDKLVVYMRVCGLGCFKSNGEAYFREDRVLIKENSTKKEREVAIKKAGFEVWWWYSIEDRIGNKMSRIRLTIENTSSTKNDSI